MFRERTGEGQFAFVEWDASFQELFELAGLPLDEVGEVDGLRLAGGRGCELDDQRVAVDGVGDVEEETGIGEALQSCLDLLFGKGNAGGQSSDAEGSAVSMPSGASMRICLGV